MMHSYDVEGRGRIYTSLAVLSVILVWLLDVGLDRIDIDPLWWLSAPSMAGIYAGLFSVFDRYAWRWRLLGKLGILSVPDLRGRWIGEINSSYGEDGAKTEISATILQRWSAILISLEARESSSRSTMAVLKTQNIERPELIYAYLNEPRSRASETMQIHRGTCTLRLTGDKLVGDYYTGRGRGTVGELSLKRKA